ncbi:Asp-tRNA(Asn)/Glu-tRNA(Gln) amidotransferase subunit GatA [Candidatus Woesearchaeota archaeon]|nr:Asp-tRNA(Asn)/Glu-tRNA(Gln) amidotransferase subunit GatA [Candidatus Woesearchaeota archaeon]
MDLKSKLGFLRAGKLSPVDNARSYLEKIKREDKKINSFLHVNENVIEEAKLLEKSKNRGRLYGLVIGVKSAINVRGLIANCASKTLENYRATYDADVVSKIKEEGGLIIGMTNCDEFCCGSSGEHSAFGPTKNPANTNLITGGSSSGSAAAVKAEFCDLSLGSDTGGSIRNPASHCGVVGVKPSYGLVSRYGLIDLSMSLDQIGPLSREVYGSALLLSVIAGKSKRDATMFNSKIPEYEKNLKLNEEITVGVCKDFKDLCEEKEIYELVEQATGKLVKNYKLKLVKVDLKHIKLAVQTYYPLVYTEFYSGTRKFDGRKYGFKIEDVCGEEGLRRILGGKIITQSEFKGMYYRKALKAKEIIKQELQNAFKKVDCIISPAVPSLPHKIGAKIPVEAEYAYDAFTIPANLGGICAGVVQAGNIKGVPVGLQIMCNSFNESKMFKLMGAVESG